MEQLQLKEILEQHQLWIAGKGGSRAYLRDANLRDTNLRDTNLRGANLQGADLIGANLRDANLEGANLQGAYLTGANLYRANLERAYLTGAILAAANLTGAILERANLTGAILYDANLKDANLGGADLTSADLTSADLKDTIGLPDVSWIIPGCLAQLNKIGFGFYLEKEGKSANFVQDSIGFFIQNNPEEGTFDMLVEDRIIRNIPDWVKYSGLKQAATESV
jgi:hypothetical protein